MMTTLLNVLLVVHVVVSVLLIGLVLMQRPRSEGLGVALGGGVTERVFGPETTSVLRSATRWLGVIFFALTLLLSVLSMRHGAAQSSVRKALASSEVAAVVARG